MICQCCETNLVESKKRPLCKRCYQKLHKAGLLDTYPLIIDRTAIESKYSEKYGEQIVSDFKAIINNPDIRLNDIAVKYGFTRERARQLFKLINGFSYTNVKKTKAYKQLIQQSIEKIDPIRRAKEHKGHVGIAAKSEEQFYLICKSLNFDIYPKKNGNVFDFVVNGFNVDVKTATHSYSFWQIGPRYYHFSMTERQHSGLDFLACHAAPEDDFYIIPKSALSSRSVYIRDKKTGGDQAIDKYEGYKGAFQLMMNNIPDGYSAKRLLGCRSNCFLGI